MLQMDGTADETTDEITDATTDGIEHAPGAATPEDDAPEGRRDRRRAVMLLAIGAFAVVRIESIIMLRPFVTPDTGSYTSGQGTRPPLSQLLVGGLGDNLYILLSAIVSTAGVVAVALTIWDPRRPRLTGSLAAALLAVSFLPTFHVYEHWLIPDSMLVGLCGIALALAWPRTAPRWRTPAFAAVLVLITLTKEIGFSLAVLLLLVAAIRWSWRVALVGAAVTGLLFVVLISPASDRPGRVLTQQPLDTPLTMDRFRVMVAGMSWTDLDDRLAVVEDRAAECGMTFDQFVMETFGLTDQVVHFYDCERLWDATDGITRTDILLMHAKDPKYVLGGVERGFAPNMFAMALWSDYELDAYGWMRVDRYLAAAVAVTPLVALGCALARRRGRRLALVAMAGSALALSAILVDPTGQDRHAAPFRLLAFMIALLSIREAFDSDPAASVTADEPQEPATATAG